ncbi:hypothetical protein F8M41_013211 [Gigaspora margarita]|uniref:Uncharacterized protein n=1 Tax=Gigaspora margarita TaxID=4874 RepID=A0A8H4ASG3_GIGMA|nr:hypothetical protein F8M41_013211 [Gigaspora margarita]
MNEPDFFFEPDLFIEFDPINDQNKTTSTLSKLYKSNMARTDTTLFENELVTFNSFLKNNDDYILVDSELASLASASSVLAPSASALSASASSASISSEDHLLDPVCYQQTLHLITNQIYQMIYPIP